MSTNTIVIIAISLVVVLIIAAVISIYNELVKKRILTREGYSGIGVCLQQRNDLIPNLVETVKGYAGHENKTLIEVTKWRNQSAAATTLDEQNAATIGLNKAMSNMLAVAESYPELKADAHFLELMQDLSRIEDKINDSRRYYNGTVREYNQTIGVFPKNMVAGLFHFQSALFFQEDVEAKTAPKVAFQ